MMKTSISTNNTKYRNKLNGDIYESQIGSSPKFIDGVEFIAVTNKHGRINFIRKDTLEKLPNR
jgi:hypothetical protein